MYVRMNQYVLSKIMYIHAPPISLIFNYSEAAASHSVLHHHTGSQVCSG